MLRVRSARFGLGLLGLAFVSMTIVGCDSGSDKKPSTIDTTSQPKTPEGPSSAVVPTAK